jgi:MFS family permease
MPLPRPLSKAAIDTNDQPGGLSMIAQQQSAVATPANTWFSFLTRERTVARPGYSSRWLIPPAALCIHLCIGQAYAFSVFNLPMTKLIGVTQAMPADWSLTDLGWIFSLAIFFLGFSAALSGRWVEEGGPRRAMFTAALCWSGGFFLSAIGVYFHFLWLIYIGYGVLVLLRHNDG